MLKKGWNDARAVWRDEKIAPGGAVSSAFLKKREADIAKWRARQQQNKPFEKSTTKVAAEDLPNQIGSNAGKVTPMNPPRKPVSQIDSIASKKRVITEDQDKINQYGKYTG